MALASGRRRPRAHARHSRAGEAPPESRGLLVVEIGTTARPWSVPFRRLPSSGRRSPREKGSFSCCAGGRGLFCGVAHQAGATVVICFFRSTAVAPAACRDRLPNLSRPHDDRLLDNAPVAGKPPDEALVREIAALVVHCAQPRHRRRGHRPAGTPLQGGLGLDRSTSSKSPCRFERYGFKLRDDDQDNARIFRSLCEPGGHRGGAENEVTTAQRTRLAVVALALLSVTGASPGHYALAFGHSPTLGASSRSRPRPPSLPSRCTASKRRAPAAPGPRRGRSPPVGRLGRARAPVPRHLLPRACRHQSVAGRQCSAATLAGDASRCARASPGSSMPAVPEEALTRGR